MPELVMVVDTALAEVPVNIAPLIDDTDFKSRETTVAFNQAGMDLVWNFVTSGGAMTQTAVTPTSGGTYDWAHQGDGMYSIEIPASGGASINNDTEGFGWFTGFATGILPWRGPIIQFSPANVVNALVNGSDALEVDVTQANGDAASTTTGKFNVNVSTIDANAITASAIADNAIDAGALAADCITAAKIADNAIDAGAIAANAITAAKIATDAITSTQLAASAVTEIQSGLSTLDAAGVRTAVGLASANLDTQLSAIDDFLDTEVAAILADTNELQTDWANGGRLDNILDARASQTSLDTLDDFVDTEVAAIKAKTDNLPSDPADASDIAALIDALPTAAENAAALLDLANGIETSITPRQAIRLILAASAGKLSGAATTTVTIRNVGDSKDRITATVDADGNRSAVTVDAT